jgi:hypothetical protein
MVMAERVAGAESVVTIFGSSSVIGRQAAVVNRRPNIKQGQSYFFIAFSLVDRLFVAGWAKRLRVLRLA